MSGGALIDLVAKGAQDAYLTGSPEVSFFRQNFKRHTNFAMKPSKLNVLGTVGAGNEISIKIPNKGDLLDYVWIDLNNQIGSKLGIETANPAIFELWIGGQMVDRQDATFMALHWQKFLVDSGAKAAAAFNVGSDSTRANLLASTFLPLHFSFCDDMPLPLVALQYHEVEIRVKFPSTFTSTTATFYANFIVIDTSERQFFTSNDHEILIEQVQRLPVTSGTGGNVTFDLSLLNHPVKSLHWTVPSDADYDTGSVMIWLNGTSLFDDDMPDKYFTTVQGYYHSDHASELLKVGGTGTECGDGLKMYSFARKPSKHFPTGSCNFSRLDNAEMKISGADTSTGAYLNAVNWNILRIKSGMAGIAFSN